MPARPDGRAAFASRPETGRGRVHAEAESAYRTAFQRDRDRIVHSNAFRRLQYKTQVFVNHDGDHFRTRLTHSLEVAQIARTLARALGLDEDLAEAVALAHDLGHTPFGHAGEEALDAAASTWGGFDHNVQTFRIVTDLERRYAGFDGLNLTLDTLDGLVKHNGPVQMPAAPVFAAFAAAQGVALATWGSAEAQVAALADDVAYTAHDLDDGLRAGLFGLDEAVELPLVAPAVAALGRHDRGLDDARLKHEVLRRVVDSLVSDVLAETGRRVARHRPDGPAAVAGLNEPLVAFSAERRAALDGVRAFLHARMYRHYKVQRMANKARRVVKDLYGQLDAHPECLPDDWRARAEGPPRVRARAVSDYIAGMTDRFALDEHARLFDPERLTR